MSQLTFEEFAAKLDGPKDPVPLREFFQELRRNCSSPDEWVDYSFRVMDEVGEVHDGRWAAAYNVASNWR